MTDSLDTGTSDHTHLQKPDAIDSPVYSKPNAYETENGICEPPHEKESVPLINSNAHSVDTIVEIGIGDSKRPVSPVEEEGTEPTAVKPDVLPGPCHHTGDIITSTLLSHAPVATTTVNHDVALHVTYTPTLGSNSSGTPSPSTSTSSRDSKKQLLQSLYNNNNIIRNSKKKKSDPRWRVYEIRKQSLGQPHLHEIYLDGTKTFRKEQPHSYSWGFHNLLYRMTDGELLVAEARRRAFQKEIFIKSTGEEEHELVNRAGSHLFFVYETECQGYRLRWKRPSLLSHDMTCEIIIMLPDDEKKKIILAEFDSHSMGYLIQLGHLTIDKTALEQLFEDPQMAEAKLLITCCTLIDLMREVVEKAVGLGNGGVAGSD